MAMSNWGRMSRAERDAAYNSTAACPGGPAYGSVELPALVADSRTLHAHRAAQHRAGALLPVPQADHFTVLDELRRPGGTLLTLARALKA